jgi:hypothetical protein
MALQPWRLRALVPAFLLAALIACLATPSASAAQGPSACASTGHETIATDKARYPTEDLVQLSGSGYAPGCDVIVRVVRPDGTVVTGDGTETTGSDTVTTDTAGRLAYDYRLATVTGTYHVYVVQPETGEVLASVDFEDAAILNNLRLGGAAGAENYVYATGNQVFATGSVSNSRNYRFTVIRSDGTSLVGPCTPTSSTTTGGSEIVTSTYTVQASDPASGATPYTFRLQEFPNNDPTCLNATPSTADLQFSVARAASYADSALTTPRGAFGLGASAYVRIDGVTASQADWSTTWIPPSGSTACANTLGTDRPDSSTAGRLPDAAGSFLQYAPNGAGAAWNLSASFDAGATCPAFGPANDGQWRLRLQRDATHFVELPAFLVATTPPQTTIDSGPSGTTTNDSPSFAFSSDKPGSTFRCRLDGPGAATGSYAPCSSAQSYSGLAQGSYTFSVYATDAAGNDDATPATRSFTVDTVLPAVTLTTPADGSTTVDITPLLAGAAGDSAGDSATVTVNLYAGASVSGSPVRTFAVTRSGSTWSVADGDWDAGVPLRAPLTDGVYTARAEQSDAGGPGQSGTRTFRVDTAPPTTTDDVPATTQTSDITVTLTALDSGSGVQATYYTTDDSDPADGSNPSRATYDPASKPVLQDGDQIRYYSVDAAGNAEPVRTSGIAKVDAGSTLVAAEGDQEPNPGSSLTGPSSGDWLGYWNSGRVNTMVDPNALDDYFIGGTKEEAPMFWGFQYQAGGVTPAKSNIQAAWTSLEATRSTTFLYMAFKREGTTGNTFLTFELNQGTDSYMNSTGATIPCRTNGDLLVSFETGNPPKVTVYKWVSTAPGPPSCPQGAIGTFVSSGPLSPSQFQGRMNTAPIQNHLDTGRLGTSFPTNSFGEAGIDLPAILQQLNGTPCAAFSRVHVHSRSSEQISSQLQDNVGPYPLNVQSCAVTGTKFEDRDADGTRDGGEPALAGFRMYVDLDGDGSLDAGEPSDVSDAAGAYQITAVPAGSYDVREALTPAQQAAGWTCSKPSGGCAKAIEMTMGGNTSGVEFGNWAPATVSGTTWDDANRNGFRDGGEPVLSGVTVFVDYDGDGVRDPGEPFATSSGDGSYTITGVRPGSRVVRQEPPAGYVCTAPAGCATTPITVVSRDAITERDFGDAASGRVSGTKFEDADADGVRDAGELSLAGWTVYADYNGNGARDAGEPSDDTDAAGDYAIEDVRPGTHRIREVAQGGWTCSLPKPCSYVESFVAGTDATDRDFGAWRPGSVSGTVYGDVDEDGLRGGGESGLGGWTVYLDYDGNGVLDAGEPTAVSSPSGGYAITGVRPGSYSLRQVAQGGWRCTAPLGCAYSVITVTSGATLAGNDFGDAQSTTASGTKYADHDRNGARGPGEPGLSGWTVFVDYDNDGVAGPLEPSAVTDLNGDYTITRIAPNTSATPYTVREVPQTDWVCTEPAPACEFGGFVIAGGSSVTGLDFGAYRLQSVSGRTYEDREADGAQGAGDPALPGTTVWVETVAENGVVDPGEPSAVSDSRGYYLIPDVPPGSFKLRQADRAGWSCSVATADASGCFRSITLAAGSTAPGNDFGSFRPASVSGTAFDDADRDGSRGVDELAAAGMTVVVETVAANGVADPGEPTAVTGADGGYEIGGLAPRTTPYRVLGLPSSGHTCTFPAGCDHHETLLSGDVADGRDFGVVAESSVSGTQFDDLDADGLRDAGEPGLSGWTMWVDYDNDGARGPGEPADTTDSNGDYSIDEVRLGSFRVRQEPVGGWTCSFPASCSWRVDFTAGGDVPGRDFGAWQPGSVSGRVFDDLDRDGAEDGGEPGLATWTVFVDYDGDEARDGDEPHVATAGDGSYAIPGVRPGRWQVHEELQGQYACTSPVPCERTAKVTSGGGSTGNDFGNAEPGVTVEGSVFHDLDADGAARPFDALGDPLEPGLGGRQVWLETVDINGMRDPGEPSTTTNDVGDYGFRNLNPGSFVVAHAPDTAWTCSYPAACGWSLSAVGGDSVVGQDFGEWTSPGISGRVYEDLNADGAWDGGEPYLNGWRVYLDVNDNGAFDAGTDPDSVSATVGADAGTYSITGIVPDGQTHAVREVPPSGSWECSEPGNATSGTDCTRSFLNESEATQSGDFGNYREVTIAGTKYEDLNADGDRDAGEPALGGRTIKLDPATPGDASDDLSVTTAGDGSYSFTGLTPGVTYRVHEDPAAGWTCTDPASCEHTVPTASGDGTLGGRDFGAYRLGSIGGTKYEDLNADGDRDAGEPGLGGRTITLDPGTPSDAGDDSSVTTAGDGSYSFPGLEPGTVYRVHDEGESGWTCSEPGSPCEYSIPLSSGEADASNDFGAYRNVSIGGTKYEDLNADGDRDAGEPALGGRTIKLDPGTPLDGSDDDSATTAGDGSYSFTNLTPGTTYRVYDEGETGWTCSEPGSPCEYSVPTASGDGTLGSRDFGAYRDVAISGRKYEDLNADGDRDAGEPPLSGKTLVLDPCTPGDANDDVTVTTAADGTYTFAGLKPGISYCVRDEGEPGWTCTEPGSPCEYSVPTASGDGTLGSRDFGAYRQAAVSGTTFEDLNADGDRDAGEGGIGGRTIYVDADSSGSLTAGDRTTTSASDGAWSFDLGPGSYVIREELPDSTWHCSLPSGACEHAVTLTSGAGSTGNDFGSWQEVGVSGTKYEDRDGDGDRDAGEPPLGGRTLILDPCTPGDASDDVTVTTAADGTYTFGGLRPGVSYCVRDEGEPGWTCTDPGAGCQHTITPESGDGVAGGRDFGAYRAPTLEVRQVIDPVSDAGRFDLQIDHAVEKAAAAHGESTGRKPLAPGDHAVAHEAVAPTKGSDYDSSLECRADGGMGDVVPSSGGTVALLSGDAVLCTFRSVRRPVDPPVPPVDPPVAPPVPPVVPPAPPVEPPTPVDECGADGAQPQGAAAGCDRTPPPATDEACLKRPIVTWVKGRGVSRVVFYLDGKRRETVTRPDEHGRFSMRTERSSLSPGKHEVRARVYFRNAKRAPRTLRFQIEPCLRLDAPKRIETTAKPGELDACAGGSFRAYVRGETIRRVIFYMDGRRVKSTRVADWKGRYWVTVKPSALSAGSHELRARMYFISGSKQRSQVLKLAFRRCGG